MNRDQLTDATMRAILTGGKGEQEQRKRIAQAQVDTFGFKPWTSESPTIDALDRPIIFMDADGGRYSVHNVRPDGSHVRREHGAPQFIGQTTSIVVVAKSQDAAWELASEHCALMLEQRNDKRVPRQAAGGGVIYIKGVAARYRFDLIKPHEAAS